MTYNPFALDGKTYLITGAASGIGKEASIVLSKLGARLILVDVNAEGIENTAKECCNNVKVLQYDLSNISKIKNEIIQITSDFGKLNGLVHIAGKPYISPLKTVSEQKCDEIYRINTYAAIELSKLMINKTIYSGDSGSVVFISSVYGIVGSAANVCYAMSKSALHGITRSLSIELASKGIRVNCIAPGFVKTNMLDGSSSMFNSDYFETINRLHPLGLGEPEDVAFCIAYLLSDAAKWVTGAIISVDGGFTAQ